MERAKFNGIPESVKAKVAEVDAEARVILFGSRARGDHHLMQNRSFLTSLKMKTPGINTKSQSCTSM